MVIVSIMHYHNHYGMLLMDRISHLNIKCLFENNLYLPFEQELLPNAVSIVLHKNLHSILVLKIPKEKYFTNFSRKDPHLHIFQTFTSLSSPPSLFPGNGTHLDCG